MKLLIKIVESMSFKLKTLEEAKKKSQREKVEVLDESPSERQIPI